VARDDLPQLGHGFDERLVGLCGGAAQFGGVLLQLDSLGSGTV
jgi:hypothetical protein